MTFALFVFSANTVHAQTPQAMEVSKQQFIDMSINMAEKASEMQADMKTQSETSLREKLGEEEFKKHQAQTQKDERAAEEKLATCLGISHSKLKSFETTMGVEFQVNAIDQCKSKLPEKIDMSGAADPTKSEALAPYVSCMEEIAIKQTGVPAEKIKSCAAAHTE